MRAAGRDQNRLYCGDRRRESPNATDDVGKERDLVIWKTKSVED